MTFFPSSPFSLHACLISPQRVIGTIQSAIRGGLMCSRSGLKFATDKGLIPARPNNTYLDEIIGWGLAALGAYVQVSISTILNEGMNIH